MCGLKKESSPPTKITWRTGFDVAKALETKLPLPLPLPLPRDTKEENIRAALILCCCVSLLLKYAHGAARRTNNQADMLAMGPGAKRTLGGGGEKDYNTETEVLMAGDMLFYFTRIDRIGSIKR
ncbi:hypothetical protein K504DRAFT_74345 [Pleomassaria siparia CBS 279.74]|uniref:Uncharacterized protein n=1 Tax=Pleomassaria siparia CBS 279.74 TaxID=1314801 RepID=A0A6G1JZV1_9PLEO|nr:hypothetical protein K504DRAFT_74345 [Pleomassaria siparia CBS 279.74]